ncbi:MAG TPA: Mur ligase family protein [Bacteroidales bacterium]|nr:Mur ligase family protein [Bacteroidales bacterium]
MRIHFIAIGGAVMHNLAIALHKKGYQVTGSDDEIFEPSKSRLDKYGLLPPEWGWHPEKLDKSVDAVILGMHAREDNPELKQARKLGLKIYSFPEYLYEQTKKKKRVVIAGSHGKTTITSMIMHVLRDNGVSFDYMVGSQLEGFDTMVNLEETNRIAVFEGDEYLSSPLDKRPKFMHYKADIALISGIAWDHMNVFPEYKTYLEQFTLLTRNMDKDGTLVYNEADEETRKIANAAPGGIHRIPYQAVNYRVSNDRLIVYDDGEKTTLNIFGKHNMENLAGAMKIGGLLGVNKQDFLSSMKTFKGAKKRQELLSDNGKTKVYLDFAHAPSKVKATVEAFKEMFPDKKLTACLEIHTYSSLNKNFLPQYKGSLDKADEAALFYNPEVVAHKKMEALSAEVIRECFALPRLKVFDNREELEEYLGGKSSVGGVLLLMSSGNFSGMDFERFKGR